MALGVVLALLATVCFAAGSGLEKKAVDRLPRFARQRVDRAIRDLLASRWWLAGAALSALGLVCQILAFDRIAISIVQSVGVTGVVLLVVLSRLVFRERLGRLELAGMIVAMASLVLVSLSLTRHSDAAGERAASGAILISLGCTLFVVAILFTAQPLRRGDRGLIYGCTSGLFYGLSGLGSKGLSTLIDRDGWQGALSHMFATPFPYVFATCWALGLALFQAGIQRGRVGVVGSLSGMVSSIFVVAVGTPVFGERLPTSPRLLVLRLVGFAGILIASALVAWGGPVSSVEPPGPLLAREPR